MPATSSVERRFQSLLESAPDAILIVDERGKIEIVNGQTEAMFGYRRSQLIGQPVELLVPESLGAAHVRHRDGYVKEPHTRPMGAGLDLGARRKDGSELPVEISLSPLRTDEGLLVIAVVRDITERRAAEQALRESERRFREFVEGTDDLVTRIDTGGELIYVNRSAEAVFGLPAERCAGRPMLDFVHPDDRELTRQTIDGLMAERQSSATLENRQVDAEGEAHYMLWTINPQYDRGGRLTSVTSIGRDITDRKRFEDVERRRREAQHQLEAERVEARMRQEILRRSISAQEDERRRIARELHDETGQSLTGVILGLGRLRSASDLDGARAEAENLSKSVVSALQELRMLATRLRPTALDDLGLVAAVEALAAQAPVAEGTEISFNHKGVQGRLDPAAETAIYRIVQEALTNAGKYARAEKVEIELIESQGTVTARVRDDGKGFDVDEVASKGLGLAGMRERAALVGGKLAVNSKPGQGTEIVLKMKKSRS